MVKVKLLLAEREAMAVREFCEKHGIEYEEIKEVLDAYCPFVYAHITLQLPDGTEVCESPWIPAIEDPKGASRFIKRELACVREGLSEDEKPLVTAIFFRLPGGALFAILDDETLRIITADLCQKVCHGYEDWEPSGEWQKWQEEFMDEMLGGQQNISQ